MTRRELVASIGAAGAVAAVPPAWAKQLLPPTRRIGPGAFNDGVASGEPSRTVTFWSRLETSRPRSGARLVVATDPGMRNIVAHTIVPTGRGVNGALKARIGGLKPHTEYYYVWESGTNVSPIGRTLTAPVPGSAQPLLLGVSSCQSYGSGYYTAHADAAAPADLTSTCSSATTSTRPVRARTPCATTTSTPSTLPPIARSTRSTAATRTCASCIAPSARTIWDDHEVENNYSDNNPPPPSPGAGRLPRVVRVDAADVVPQRPPPRLQALSYGLSRHLPARRAPVPHGQQRRPAASYPRRGADAPG